ncbi:MazG-like family protein [Peribacillus frigoritolerans]|uniref:MazG-like family protein n=1 Tax=Peribacillus frigoritolerans TaxID=450367 RepID=UPI0020BDAB5C|nr:MazG-like family protein [Peribacillus frigoritolerans]
MNEKNQDSSKLEASELFENFQWKSNDEALKNNSVNIEDELADILIYSILFADSIKVDINDIISNKKWIIELVNRLVQTKNTMNYSLERK